MVSPHMVCCTPDVVQTIGMYGSITQSMFCTTQLSVCTSWFGKPNEFDVPPSTCT